MKICTRVVFGLLGVLLVSGATPAAADRVNLLSLQEGAYPVRVPSTYGGWGAERLLDDSAKTGWACEAGHPEKNVFVFELPSAAVIERFEFDNAAIDAEGASAREVVVEVSVTSAKEGFSKVLKATLADKRDGQRFTATAKPRARWVRLTILNNHGNPDYTELFSFRGIGERPTAVEAQQISGTYHSTYGDFHLRQQGTALVGCYEFADGLLEGVIEGRVMKLTWQENNDPEDRGPAVMVFPEGGKSFHGFWWRRGNTEGAPNGEWNGEKRSDAVGGCPQWSGSVSGQLKKKLAGEKRARLYGLLFDLDSAVLKSASKPVLDELLALLKGEPEWSLLIEGHTDAVGAAAKNLELSRQRAESVKAYLVAAGIEAARLKVVGLGETKPVAENSSELGRAQNRRVELVRE